MRSIAIYAAIMVWTMGYAAQRGIEWNSTCHDFGVVYEDSGRVEARFFFRNCGTDTISITSARVSCGCTGIRYRQMPVLPGDTSSVVVRYDPTGQTGRFEKKAYIYTNASAGHSTLIIRGTVIGSQVSVASRYPVDIGGLRLSQDTVTLGYVSKGDTRTAYCYAYNASNDTIYPVTTSTGDYIRTITYPHAIPPGETASVIIRLYSAICPVWGDLTESITISSDSINSGSSLTLPVKAYIKENFAQTTAEMSEKAPAAHIGSLYHDFGKIGNDATHDFLLHNTGYSTLKIRRVYSNTPGVDVDIDTKNIEKGDTAIIRVKINRDKINGSHINGRISLITNDPVNPIQEITISGDIDK